jgi:hypothetical protein
MVLGNRNIISPLRVRGLDYRSGSEFSCHNNKAVTSLCPSCPASGLHVVIVWFEV